MKDSLSLSEHPGDIVRLSCEKCGRSGQYAAARFAGGQCDHIGSSSCPRGTCVDGAFPQLFGWLLQSGQVVGGELYQGG